MIKFANICPHCGTEWWEKHECEGTRREAAEKARLEAERVAREDAALARLEAERVAREDAARRARELEEQLNRAPRILVDLDPYVGTVQVFNDQVNDSVNHPKHYTSHPSGVECIDITKHYNFQVGNAMKYLWRQGLKDDASLDPGEKQIEDCEKAIWYINSYINDLKGK